jgi:intracellular sulfur oxidation DsrE/DsrF family protein
MQWRRLAWFGLAVAIVLCGFAAAFVLHSRGPDPRLVFPRIHGAGGVLPVDAGAAMPSPTAVHKLYVDVENDDADHGDVNARLNTAAKILNLYALAGVPSSNVRMVILFYGTGVGLALSDEAYRERFHHDNPNAELLTQLRRAGVKMEVCGQALGHQQLTPANLHAGAQLALSALTAREELQAAGYGAVPTEAH